MQQKLYTRLSSQQLSQLTELWNQEYPAQLQHRDPLSLKSYLHTLPHPEHILLLENGVICGWLFTFDREEDRWFGMMVRREQQGKGLGRQLLEEAMKREPHLNGWAVDVAGYQKADGSAYSSPLPFYLRMGFKVIPGERFETEALSTVKIVWSRSDQKG